MPDTDTTPELPAKDRLMTRPDDTPLPSAIDLHAPQVDPADPKPVPKPGQGTDPKADKLDYTA